MWWPAERRRKFNKLGRRLLERARGGGCGHLPQRRRPPAPPGRPLVFASSWSNERPADRLNVSLGRYFYRFARFSPLGGGHR